VRQAAARGVGRTVRAMLVQAREDKLEEMPRFDDARTALSGSLRTDKADAVREACAEALGAIGPDARATVGALAGALKDKHPGTVTAAAGALRRMGRDAREAVSDLQQLLADKKAGAVARTHAAAALGHLPTEARDTVPTLREVLGDVKAPATVRRTAAETLGRLGRDAGVAAGTLGTVLTGKDSSDALRLAAATALDQIGPDARAALPALVKAVADADRTVGCVAMHAIGRMSAQLADQRKGAVTALVRCLDDSSIEARMAAIQTLGVVGSDGLGEQTEEVLKRLDGLITREGRKVVRDAAQNARDKIRPKAKKPKG
jgi:hypothetical protein